MDTVGLWVSDRMKSDLQIGEDDDNVNHVHQNTVSIQNIVLSANKRGADFDAKRDVTVQEVIMGSEGQNECIGISLSHT